MAYLEPVRKVVDLNVKISLTLEEAIFISGLLGYIASNDLADSLTEKLYKVLDEDEAYCYTLECSTSAHSAFDSFTLTLPNEQRQKIKETANGMINSYPKV